MRRAVARYRAAPRQAGRSAIYTLHDLASAQNITSPGIRRAKNVSARPVASQRMRRPALPSVRHD